MILSNNNNIELNRQTIDRVKSFKYFRTIIEENGNLKDEMDERKIEKRVKDVHNEEYFF